MDTSLESANRTPSVRLAEAKRRSSENGDAAGEVEYFHVNGRVLCFIEFSATWQPATILRIESNTFYKSWRVHHLWKPDFDSTHEVAYVLAACYPGEVGDRLLSWNGDNCDPLPHEFRRLQKKDTAAERIRAHSIAAASPADEYHTPGLFPGMFLEVMRS